MAAIEFSFDSVKLFIQQNGGRVKNHELVTHFKGFLNDPQKKDEMREKFKNLVNELATIKVDEQNDKILVLKKKYRVDSGGGNQDWESRARSEPPIGPDEGQHMYSDRTDGAMQSRVKSEGSLSASDLRLSVSTLSSVNDNGSLGSVISTSSQSSGNQEDDVNLSVLSVKERAKHLNRMESESELQKTSTSQLGATRKKDPKKAKDREDSDESGGVYTTLEPLEKEWLVTCSASEYHSMHQLLSKNPDLAKVKDFCSTALHWAAKHGRPEVVKLLVGKPGVNVNQKTGYTALHLAAVHGHEEIIELLINGFKADPNIRDYSGKKAKQYLRNSASTRTNQLLSSRMGHSHGHKSSHDKVDNSGSFTRDVSGRRSNRASAIKSLIQLSTGTMRQAVMRSSWGSSEDVGKTTPRSSPSLSPRNSAEPSPVISRKISAGSRDENIMPPPVAPVRGGKSRRQQYSSSRENLCSEDKKLSAMKQVSRSESEPNLGEATLSSKSTFV